MCCYGNGFSGMEEKAELYFCSVSHYYIHIAMCCLVWPRLAGPIYLLVLAWNFNCDVAGCLHIKETEEQTAGQSVRRGFLSAAQESRIKGPSDHLVSKINVDSETRLLTPQSPISPFHYRPRITSEGCKAFLPPCSCRGPAGLARAPGPKPRSPIYRARPLRVRAKRLFLRLVRHTQHFICELLKAYNNHY